MATPQIEEIASLSWDKQRLYLYAAIKSVHNLYGKEYYSRIIMDTHHTNTAGFDYKTLQSAITRDSISPNTKTRFRGFLNDILLKYSISFIAEFEEMADKEYQRDDLFNLIKKNRVELTRMVTVDAPPLKSTPTGLSALPTDPFRGVYQILGMNTGGFISIKPVLIMDGGKVEIVTTNDISYSGEVKYDGSEGLSFYFDQHMTVENQYYFSHYLFSVCRLTRFLWAYGVSSRLSKFGYPKAGLELLMPVNQSFREMKYAELTADRGNLKSLILKSIGTGGKPEELEAQIRNAIDSLLKPPIEANREPVAPRVHQGRPMP